MAHSVAAEILGEQVYWDWDGNALRCQLIKYMYIYSYSIAPRTREGYYHYTGGVEAKFPLLAVEINLKTFYPRQQ
jgi:isocitrate lyase